MYTHALFPQQIGIEMELGCSFVYHITLCCWCFPQTLPSYDPYNSMSVVPKDILCSSRRVTIDVLPMIKKE